MAAAARPNHLSTEYHDIHRPEWFVLASKGASYAERSHSVFADAGKALKVYLDKALSSKKRYDFIVSKECTALLKHAVKQGLNEEDKEILADYEAERELRTRRLRASKRLRDDDDEEDDGKAFDTLEMKAKKINQRLNVYVGRLKDAAYPDLKRERAEKREAKKAAEADFRNNLSDDSEAEERPRLKARRKMKPDPDNIQMDNTSECGARSLGPDSPRSVDSRSTASLEDFVECDELPEKVAALALEDKPGCVSRARTEFKELNGIVDLIPPLVDTVYVSKKGSGSPLETALEQLLEEASFDLTTDVASAGFLTGCPSPRDALAFLSSPPPAALNKPFAFLIIDIAELPSFLLHPSDPGIIINHRKDSRIATSFWVGRCVQRIATLKMVKKDITSLEFL